jgi:hypothetical protein
MDAGNTTTTGTISGNRGTQSFTAQSYDPSAQQRAQREASDRASRQRAQDDADERASRAEIERLALKKNTVLPANRVQGLVFIQTPPETDLPNTLELIVTAGDERHRFDFRFVKTQ